MSLPVIVIGAGGHASVVADALLTLGHIVIGFTDAASERHGSLVCGLPVLGDDSVLTGYRADEVVLANGIGSLGGEPVPLRQRLQDGLEARGWSFCQVIHPTAVVSRFAHLGDGVQVMAGSVVQAGAALGKGTIVNTAAVVEHDVTLGAWSHVAPRAVVCGNTRVGAASHIGAGATVRQGLDLGPVTLVGAGAVVVRSFSGNGALVGVPAHQMERQE
jgi:sugar O-acyltransferase (sialic acid O-acetyltransferase NeuD family)